MSGAELAQLAIILAPIAQEIYTEGSKMIITYKQKLDQSEIDKSLELSRSANWPQLDFGLDQVSGD
jgi:hypothetical protein